jgi:aldose 1-epimerase
MPESNVLSLRHGALCLELAPQVGGSIARFFSERDGEEHHWLRPATAAALAARDPLRMASFPLAPWCNRIRDGRSGFGPRPIDLPPNLPNSPHTIHGTAWRHPWAVLDVGGDHAVLAQQHRPARGARDWPYAFDVRQHYRLSPQGLAVEIELTNRSDDPMPAGIGHHPYFPHSPGTRLTSKVSAMWASDDQLLPTELVKPPFLQQMAVGIHLSDLDLDNNFIGWQHEARVEWPVSRSALVMRAEPPLDYFVLYCPKDADHFVMEPVSNCTDWMNLAERGIRNAGGTMLAPGDTLTGRFEFVPYP